MTMTQSRPQTNWRSEPVSAPQKSKIEALLQERDLTGTSYVGWEPNWAKATKGLASTVIDFLLTLPVEQAPAHAPTSKPSGLDVRWGSIPVGGAGFGYYALEVNPGEHRFFRVERPKSGKWEGKTFIKAQAGDEFFPVEPRQRGFSYLTQIDQDPKSAGLLYASLIGKCTRCGRTLTDPESRERGIGPDCFKKGSW